MDALFPPPPALEAFGAQAARLVKALERNRLSPAYLIEGGDADTLLAAARALAAAAVTGAPPGPRDPGAEGRVARGTHPDVHELTRDKQTVISVAALTEVLERVGVTPLEGVRQAFVIHPAEAMEAQGLARYLKALEEPPAHTLFLLLSTRPERLPDTVLSRCRRVRLAPLAEGAVADALVAEGAAPEEARTIAGRAGGSLGRARRLWRAGAPALLAALGDAEAPVVRTAEATLAALQRHAGEAAAEDEREGDMRRQHLREVLRDLIHALCVDARDAACGRPVRWVAPRTPAAALDLLRGLERLDLAVVSNVTPAVVVLSLAGLLRGSDPEAPPA